MFRPTKLQRYFRYVRMFANREMMRFGYVLPQTEDALINALKSRGFANRGGR